MKIYDITAPIFEGMTVYKNKPEKQPQFSRTTNAHVTESRITLDVHTGTHIDAPLHMINEGATFESIPLEKLVGPVKVFDLTTVEDGITITDLQHLDIQENDFILFKTRNSFEDEFNYEFIFLKEDGAHYLAKRNIRGVGIDALGVERSQPGHPTHKALFDANIIVIEGLRLKNVPADQYFMVAAPLKLVGTDASPARVLLFKDI
ncbi:cyclase [Bacillus pseudomycoides]|uniref:cyclase family protein n=1 Tax=Bacillus TaxID=1386 RepID=UPI0003720C65|nr:MULTISPECIES: cyclase family protein [Bacillus]MBJ8029238.1 cyclase family protein [Bacillus cereus group sp. N21]MCX2825056.1 cyclase family protein [Bacillus sp. DHT2]MDR4915210.1 cyclase family protein [Bacillus pseudomycoides]MEB3053224.1 cyclase family protein [Bacillus pseudomycoides]PDY02345.1 cyclase [Bacillus pseudomycoides]